MAIVLNTFLGCFKLRTGCLCMGYSGVIVRFLYIVYFLAGIVITGQANYTKEHLQHVNEVILGACIFLLVWCSIAFSLYVVLLVGVHQNRPKVLKVFLISMTTYIVLSFIIELTMMSTVMSPLYGIRFVICFASNIYYMLVVRSYYFNLNEDIQLQNGIKPV